MKRSGTVGRHGGSVDNESVGVYGNEKQGMYFAYVSCTASQIYRQLIAI